ncbi:MAG: hypothetical protein Q4G43_11470 [Mobilicoccus sp.]|nr:hypothetical protein [Mobilicoccus sp.]
MSTATIGWAPVDDAMPSWRWWLAVVAGVVSGVLITPLGNVFAGGLLTAMVVVAALTAVGAGLVPTLVRAWREIASGTREGGTGGSELITGALLVALVTAVPAVVAAGILTPLAALGVATSVHLVAARLLRRVVGVVPGGQTRSTAGTSTRPWVTRVDRALPWVPVVVAAIALLTFGTWALLGVLGAPDAPAATLSSGLAGALAMLAVLLVASPASFFLARFLPARAARDRGRELGILFGEVDLLEMARVRGLVFDPLGTLSGAVPRLTRVRTAGRLQVTAALRAAASVADGSDHPHHAALLGAARERAIDLRPSAPVNSEGATRARRLKDTVVTIGPATAFDVVPPDLAEGGVDLFVGWGGRARAGFELSPQVRTDVLDVWPELLSLDVRPVFVGTDAVTISHLARATETPAADVRTDGSWASAVRELQPLGPVALLGDADVDEPVFRIRRRDDVAGAAGWGEAGRPSTVSVDDLDLRSAVAALALARKTHRVTVQGLIGVTAVHLVGVTAAALGLVSPPLAVVVGAGLPLLAAANALRPRSYARDDET